MKKSVKVMLYHIGNCSSCNIMKYYAGKVCSGIKKCTLYLCSYMPIVENY